MIPKTILWIKPGGQLVETNDLKHNIEFAEGQGWKKKRKKKSVNHKISRIQKDTKTASEKKSTNNNTSPQYTSTAEAP